MRLIIPFITIGNGDGATGLGELGTALITGGFCPPVLVGKTPTSPFGHPILIGNTDSGNTRIIDRPAPRRGLGPDGIPCQCFVHIGTEGQTIKPFHGSDGISLKHLEVIDGPPPVITSIKVAEGNHHALGSCRIRQADNDTFVGVVVVEVRAIRIGFPKHDFDGFTPIEGDSDVGGLVIVAVILWTPRGVEVQFQRTAHSGNIQRPAHEGVQIPFGMRLVIPLITIGNRNRATGLGEFSAALIAGSFCPPVLVGKAPSSPFSDPVLIRDPHAGNTRIINGPPRRGRFGPDSIACQSLIHIGSQHETGEILRGGHWSRLWGANGDLNVVDGPPPIVASIEVTKGHHHALGSSWIGHRHHNMLVGSMIMEVRAVRIRFPQQHLNRCTAIEGDSDIRRLTVVAVVFRTP